MTCTGPPNPPRRWVHPCKCTLIAHEQCLLEWIRASERNPDKSTSSILKCPQCGSRYDLDSDNPLHLRIMDNLNAILTLLGSGASVVSIGSVVISLGAGIRPCKSLSNSMLLITSLRCLFPFNRLWGICYAPISWRRDVRNDTIR